MKATLTREDGTATTLTTADVAALADDPEFFWLHLEDVDGDSQTVLGETFGFHPLAVEDAEHFGQRPKVDEYDGFTYLVVYGVCPGSSGPGTLTEVHLFYTPTRVVTVCRETPALFEDIRTRLKRHPPLGVSPIAISVLYVVVDTLTDSFFPVLAEFDDRIDALEDDILTRPNDQQLSQLFSMKRQLVSYRKIVTPQRDMFARLLSGVDTLPDMTDEDARYFRDLYDHLIRISDLLDSYRDLVSAAVDTHLSTVSNRLNVVMKQLAIIATVFLPLSFLTGFFGQNFTTLTNHFLANGWAFWVFGIGADVGAVLGLVVYFRRKGWLQG